MKATIGALVRGENTIYVKQRKSDRTQGLHLHEATPIVLLFENELSGHSTHLVHDSNSSQRRIDLGISDGYHGHDPEPDYVYSLRATYKSRDGILNGHLTSNELSSIVFLHTQHMGVQRYEAICRRPARFQCRTNPALDPELASFNRTELGTAWAIKYADGCIIVVAQAGWQPSPPLQAYANTKQVEIVVLPLTTLSADLLQRLRLMHFTSTALKRHPYRDRIIDRFLLDF